MSSSGISTLVELLSASKLNRYPRLLLYGAATVPLTYGILTFYFVYKENGALFSAVAAVIAVITMIVTFAIMFYVLGRATREKLSSIETALKDIQGSDVESEAFKEAQKKRDQYEFERNIREPLTLKHVESEGYDMFGAFTWTLQPQVNVLLGRNGYGKTRLLQSIVAMLAKDSDKCAEIFKNSATDAYLRIVLNRPKTGRETTRTEALIERNRVGFQESIGKVPILAIPDSRFINKSRTDVSVSADEFKDLREYGSYHFLYQKPYESIIQNFLYQLCLDDGQTNKFEDPIFEIVQKAVTVLTDQKFKFSSIKRIGQASFTIDVLTEGNTSIPIPLQNASQGTQSILAIVGLIFSYLQNLYPDVDGRIVAEQPAIVIIDEIDAHLHPVWQRKLVGLIRKQFPKTQFILTAHSPLVVAGCLEREVAVFRREGGRFALRQFEENFIGIEPEQIYRKVFEVEEPDETYKTVNATYGDDAKQAIEERIKLLKGKPTRSAAENEELAEKQRTLQRIQDAQKVQGSRVDTWKLEEENRRLRQEIRSLEDRLETPSGASSVRPPPV